jgi:hypothetical protein
MKAEISAGRRGGTSALDLLVMLLAVGIVVMVGFAYVNRPSRGMAARINCINNLKQIGLAYRLWGGDNGDKYPAQVSTNAGGTMELVASGIVFPHFAVMSNELSTPKIILCPNDSKRTAGTNFNTLSDANVSYFAVPEADESNPTLWLSGDRNLATNGVALKSGLFTMPTNGVLNWTATMHNHHGNLCLADGSVQQLSQARLHQSATNALRDYYLATTNTSFRLLIP